MTHFVVSRLTWRTDWHKVFQRMSGETRVAAFTDFDSAETDRATREEAARRTINPFACGNVWGERSRFPEPVFRDFIKDAGIEPPTIVPVPTYNADGTPLGWKERRIKENEAPPAGTFRSWVAWWDATAPTLSAEQISRAWEGLDRVRFFRVAERPVRQVAFVVVEIAWNYNDEWYYPPAEGGGAHTAYRSRERADAECARMNAEARERWRQQLRLPAADAVATGAAFGVYPFDMQSRTFPGDDPLGPKRKPPPRVPQLDGEGKFGVDEVPFYEVIEFELPEGP